MKITRYLLISGVAAALGLGAACEKRTSDETARSTASPSSPSTPSPSGTKDTTAGMPSKDDNKQPVSGSSIYFVTDDGTRKELNDTSALSDMQQKLAKEGLYTGSIDGHPSPELSSALRRFQARNGLPDTAVVDHATANKLGLDWDKMTKANVRDEVQKGANDVKDDMKKAGEKVEDSAKDVGKEIKKDADKAKNDLSK